MGSVSTWRDGMTGEGRRPDRVPMRARPNSVPSHARGEPAHIAPAPIDVLVWLCSPQVGWRQVEAMATGWTSRAVLIEYRDEHDRADECWVWASAVQRR